MAEQEASQVLNEPEIMRNYNFIVDIGQGVQVNFSEVEGLGMRIKPIDYREGGGAPAVRKLAGRVEYNEVTFRWGMSESLELWNWLTKSVEGNVERREISVMMLKPDGTEYFRYNLHNAWVCEWNAAKLNAMDQGVAIESLVIAHEGLIRA